MADRVFVATRKGLFTISRGGRNGSGWKVAATAFLGDNVPMVLPCRKTQRVWAAITHGHFGAKMQRSEDGGTTWAELPAPAYPEPPGGQSPDVCPMRGTPIPWKLELIWSLETGGELGPDVLWCGTIPGGLFRSDDAGASWTLVRSLWEVPHRRQWFGGGYDHPGIHSILVDPRDARRVLVGVSCGGVWETTDAGESWQCRADGMFAAYMPPEQANDPAIQDPHIVVACPSSFDHLWIQHHNGIFKSADGARSWKHVDHVPVSDFGFCCAVHPHEPETAWFIPGIKDELRIPVDGRLVVTRTRDGGDSFEVLDHGLPQEHAYDIVYRHALDVDETGKCLMFGTTTGSLFVSEDGGDSWKCANHHLPPVYAVRFDKS